MTYFGGREQTQRSRSTAENILLKNCETVTIFKNTYIKLQRVQNQQYDYKQINYSVKLKGKKTFEKFPKKD